MKIKTNRCGWNAEGEISSWVDAALCDAMNDGVAERAQEVANACAEAIGRLVAALAEKGVLTAPDVYRIAKGYHNDSATFEA